jgi:hypothetical protein
VARATTLCEASGIGVLQGGAMSPEEFQSFFALAIGFALAGMLATGYQVVTLRPASFRLLERGPAPLTFAAVPFLAFAAPFIIMRNTIRGRQVEGSRFELMMLATVVAGFWSLMSGTVVVGVLNLLQV